ncbi:MAG TPA: DUF222 domain-containing protein [Propionicimonas sp.]|nr:DUF222 domain-containing protein [Propionicimonas sp.]
MDISSIATAEDARAVVVSMLSGLRQLRDAQYFKFGRDDLLATGRLLEELGRSLYAAQVRWVGEVEDSGVAAELSCSSTRVLLRDTLRIGAGDAADRVRAARMTRPREPLSGGQLPARLPLVGAAVDAGEIGPGHVAVITKAAAGWPRGVDPDTLDSAERVLVDQARKVDPGQLGKIAQRLAEILDPDGPCPDRPDPTGRMEFRVGNRNPRTGLTPFGGTFSDEAVETFRQATDALAAPRSAQDGAPDTRSPATRLAQAHLQVLRGYLDAGAGPTVGGHVPHISMTIDYDALTGQLSNATLTHGGPISTGLARRLLCDAKILPAVLNGASQILDVGRAQRLFPPHLRAALTLRDGGCAWPGCDRPPGWCQAHHITSWLDGGPTSLTNGVLLCLYHHQQAHTAQWQIRPGPDGQPDFIPPPWIDPHQHPQRNHHHHQPLRQ